MYEANVFINIKYSIFHKGNRACYCLMGPNDFTLTQDYVILVSFKIMLLLTLISTIFSFSFDKLPFMTTGI